MKNTTKTGAGILMISALALAPAASYAQIDANITSDIGATVTTTTDAAVETNTNLDTSTDVNVGVDAETNVDANTDMSTDTETRMNAETEGKLKVNASGITVLSSAQVNSDTDLEVFTTNISMTEKAVAKVDVNAGSDNDAEVKVIYRHKGKFLGFIPVTVNSTTVVKARSDTEAEVSSRLPWWSFLVIGETFAKADIENRIKNNATVKANMQANASAQAKAAVAEAVIAELNAEAQAHANAAATIR